MSFLVDHTIRDFSDELVTSARQSIPFTGLRRQWSLTTGSFATGGSPEREVKRPPGSTRCNQVARQEKRAFPAVPLLIWKITVMDLTRNHYFIIGIVLFLLGLQFRYVTSFELNENTSRFVEKRLGKPAAVPAQQFALFQVDVPPARRVVRPPRWLGWSLMSVGGVLVVFSISMMKKPG